MSLMNWVEHEKEYRLGEHKLFYHFRSNGHDGWIVDFVNQLFWNIFDISLEMLKNENVREFPIAYSEQRAYSTIANAIGRLTHYHFSERYYTDKQNGKHRTDFWCRCVDERENKISDIWIENILNRSKIIESCHNSKIKKAIEQIKTIEDRDKIKEDIFKVAFFSVYVYYEVGNKPEDLESIPENAYKEIKTKIKEYTPEQYNIVYSYLNLCETINDKGIDKTWKKLSEEEKRTLINENPYQIFLEHAPGYIKNSRADQEGHFMPFMMLVAVIEEFPKDESDKI